MTDMALVSAQVSARAVVRPPKLNVLDRLSVEAPGHQVETLRDEDFTLDERDNIEVCLTGLDQEIHTLRFQSSVCRI